MIKIFSDKIVWSLPAAIILLLLFYFLIGVVLKNHENNEVLWAKLELVWIFVGFVGVLTVVNMERLEYQLNDATFSKSRIEQYSNRVLNAANLPIPCHSMDENRIANTESLSQTEIEEICNWKYQLSKEVFSFKYAESIAPIPKSIKVNFPTSYYYDHLAKSITTYNKAIEEIKLLEKWRFVKESFGFVMLVFAFALRIIIAKRKIKRNIAIRRTK